MRRTVSIGELSTMTKRAQDRSISGLVETARRLPNGEIKRLDAAVRAFEEKYGFDTETLRNDLAADRLYETAEICEWLMLAGLRDRIVGRKARAE